MGVDVFLAPSILKLSLHEAMVQRVKHSETMNQHTRNFQSFFESRVIVSYLALQIKTDLEHARLGNPIMAI